MVGECSHSYGQLADGFQVDGPFVSRCDECVHPPVCALGQQVDERLKETDTKVLQVLRRLHLSRVWEEYVALENKSTR